MLITNKYKHDLLRPYTFCISSVSAVLVFSTPKQGQKKQNFSSCIVFTFLSIKTLIMFAECSTFTKAVKTNAVERSFRINHDNICTVVVKESLQAYFPEDRGVIIIVKQVKYGRICLYHLSVL